jgi:prepilin-type N-terminal cleavage/methylation domain-containing protein
MSNSVTNDDRGFTFVELLISSAVFSVVLLLCAVGIVQVGKMFYKGVTINRTQDTARRVADDLSQSIQFGNTQTGNFRQTGISGSNLSLCLGEVRYTYNTGVALSANQHVLWKDRIATGASCTPVNLSVPVPSINGVELLGENMRIPRINVPPPSSGVWSVDIIVAYGEDTDIFLNPSNPTQCKSSNIGGQFCAVSRINTNVIKRL